MIKRITSLVTVVVLLFCLAGCNANRVTNGDLDAPVTGEMLNTESSYVARGFIEAVFKNDRDLFEKCFPESVIANSNEVGIDLFDEYRKKVGSEGDFLGTQYLNFNELSEEGGYSDADNYKASISIITDIPEDQITSLHIEHIKVYFNVSGTNRYTEIYALTYETGGLWYMYELQDIDNGFDAE